MAKEYHDEINGVTKVDIHDNHLSNSTIVYGNKNKIVIKGNSIDYTSDLLNDFHKAIEVVNTNDKLDDDMKAQMNQIIKEAKEAVIKDSEEEKHKAKTAFSNIKPFLTKIAPQLIEVLANLAGIATFFGLAIK